MAQLDIQLSQSLEVFTPNTGEEDVAILITTESQGVDFLDSTISLSLLVLGTVSRKSYLLYLLGGICLRVLVAVLIIPGVDRRATP